MESTQAAHRAWLEAAGATVDGAGPVEVDAARLCGGGEVGAALARYGAKGREFVAV